MADGIAITFSFALIFTATGKKITQITCSPLSSLSEVDNSATQGWNNGPLLKISVSGISMQTS